jgi:hypothetical protein
MKRLLSDNPLFGPLDIVEVYEYYDQPILFTCKSITGSYYLVVWLGEIFSDDEDDEDDEDGDEGDKWLFAPMSQQRFESVRSGLIDLHAAFARVETGVLYTVIEPISPRTSTTTPDRVESIDPSLFPQEGEFLNLATETLPVVAEKTKQRAIASRHEQIDIAIQTVDRRLTEIPATRLSDILGSFQDLMNAMGDKLFGSGNSKGRHPQSTIDSMQLNVVGFSTGSFRVHTMSEQPVNLLEETDLGDAAIRIIALLNMLGDEQPLKSELMDLGARVTKSLVDLLESIRLDTEGIKVDWGSPHPDRGGQVAVSYAAAQQTISLIRSSEEEAIREFSVVGTLMGAHLRTWKFEIETADKNRYTGDIAEKLRGMDELDEEETGAIFGVGGRYEFTLEEKQIFKPMLEEDISMYRLLSLRPLKQE